MSALRRAAALLCSLSLPLLAPAFAGSALAEDLDIHAILPLTGGAGLVGQGSQKAMEAAQTVINDAGGIHGKQVHFVFHDDQSSPQTAVQLTNAVTADKPAVMLGSSLVAMCNAIAPLVKNGPMDYCLSPGAHPAAGSYQFSTSVDTHGLIEALVRYLRLEGLTKVAFMTSTDASGQDAEKGFDEILKMPENAATFHVLEAVSPADAILDFARQNNVDHIVMGARAASTMRSLLGSVSGEVATHAPCTVTVVRNRPLKSAGPQPS